MSEAGRHRETLRALGSDLVVSVVQTDDVELRQEPGARLAHHGGSWRRHRRSCTRPGHGDRPRSAVDEQARVDLRRAMEAGVVQVSTGYLAAEEVGTALRTIFRRQSNVTVRMGDAVSVRWADRTICLRDGSAVQFDYLVLAAGAETNYFGIAGMAEHSWPLYTLDDAARLRWARSSSARTTLCG